MKGKGEGHAIVENINVTSLDQNKEALIKSNGKVIFFQEHKVRKDEKKRMELTMKDEGWKVHLGPCHETGKMQRQEW